MTALLVAVLTLGAALIAGPAAATTTLYEGHRDQSYLPGQRLYFQVTELGGTCSTPDRATVNGSAAAVRPDLGGYAYNVSLNPISVLGTYSVQLSCADGSFTWDTATVRIVERLPLTVWPSTTVRPSQMVEIWMMSDYLDGGQSSCAGRTRATLNGERAQWRAVAAGEGGVVHSLRMPKAPGTYELAVDCGQVGVTSWAPVTITVSASNVSFSDVAPTNQFAAEITWLAQAGISTGYADGTFAPVTPVKRDAMSAFLSRLDPGERYPLPSVSFFTDVPTNNQFYAEISWMKQAGISTGYADGTFAPLAPVNRDAMAAFLFRTAQLDAWDLRDYVPPAISPFKDVPTTNQFYREIAWLAESGISTGWPDGTFRPLSPVNRDAMAAFLFRFVDLDRETGFPPR